MPFNDKGEFIRSSARSAQTRAMRPRSMVPQATQTISLADFMTISKGVAALAMLTGVIWFVIVFREWIVIGLVLWVIRGLRGKLC